MYVKMERILTVIALYTKIKKKVLPWISFISWYYSFTLHPFPMAEDNSQGESFFTRSRRTYTYESAKGSSNKRRVILIVIGILILLGLIAVAIFATGGKGELEKDLTPTPTPQSAPSSSPSPTAKAQETPTPTAAKLDRSDISIKVQNGSGGKGVASKASDYLKGLGYKIDSTGNADNFNYDKTVIQIKASKKQYLDQLKSDLAKNYTVGSASATLSSKESADAVVIVGAK